MAVINLKLQFGMIMVDAALMKATNDPNPVEFKRLHGTVTNEKTGDKCMGETGVKSYCKKCNVETNDFTKGLEFKKGQYIEITEEELKTLKVPTNGVIAIQETTDEDFIFSQPMLFSGRSYFLQPPAKEKFPPESFALLREGLADKGRVAIGRTSLYGREHTVALQASEHGFIMHLLRYPNEIRQEQQTPLPTPNPKQLAICNMVMDAMYSDNPKLDYSDSWADGVINLKNDKLAGVATMPAATPAPATPVSNLEDDLRRTLEAIQANKAKAPEAKPKKKKGKAA